MGDSRVRSETARLNPRWCMLGATSRGLNVFTPISSMSRGNIEKVAWSRCRSLRSASIWVNQSKLFSWLSLAASGRAVTFVLTMRYWRLCAMCTRPARSGPLNASRGRAFPIPWSLESRTRGEGTKLVIDQVHSSVPRLVSTSLTPAEKPPYSAAYGFGSNRTVSTASSGRVVPNSPVTGSDTLTLFTRRLVWVACPPFTLNRPSLSRTTPGSSGSRASKFSPRIGTKSNISPSRVSTSIGVSRMSSGTPASASTSTSTSSVAVGMLKLTSAVLPGPIVTADRVTSAKPASDAVIVNVPAGSPVSS